MATNPMQRKAKNSFLLGFLLMLLIAAIVVGFLLLQLVQANQELDTIEASKKTTYALKVDVTSGAEITADMLATVSTDASAIPTDAITPGSIEEGSVARINLTRGTILTENMITNSEGEYGDDLRLQEYNMLVLPIDLTTGDYIDIRLMLPSGQDYIVVSKKEVEMPLIGGVESADTIWVNMTEDEILHMSCAIYDAYRINGAKLYVTKYTEAGMQEAATPTYPVNESTSALLTSDPNILERAMEEIRARYSENNSSSLRNDYINSAINSQGEQADTNIQTNMEESITNSKNSRQEYLDSLAGATTTE